MMALSDVSYIGHSVFNTSNFRFSIIGRYSPDFCNVLVCFPSVNVIKNGIVNNSLSLNLNDLSNNNIGLVVHSVCLEPTQLFERVFFSVIDH